MSPFNVDPIIQLLFFILSAPTEGCMSLLFLSTISCWSTFFHSIWVILFDAWTMFSHSRYFCGSSYAYVIYLHFTILIWLCPVLIISPECMWSVVSLPQYWSELFSFLVLQQVRNTYWFTLQYCSDVLISVLFSLPVQCVCDLIWLHNVGLIILAPPLDRMSSCLVPEQWLISFSSSCYLTVF